MDNDSMPFEVNDDPYEKTIRGVFGRFQTRDSYRLNYLLASIPFDEIDQLSTAAEAISFADPEVTFAQLIQRDIDHRRVARIVSGYLEAGSNRVIFFPPLLVAPLGLKDGVVVKQYVSAKASFRPKEYVQTWESGYFQLTLPTTEKNTGETVSVDGQTRYFYNFGAQLRYNPHLVRLIVIDGQHRLQALRALKNRGIADTIEIPVCIVFTPNAIPGNAEEITADLRELFVRVNQEATKVSGHFITLLNDNSLSAATIRSLGDLWKGHVETNGYTPLHLLEWNQREAKLAFQVTRETAITTVSIVTDTLQRWLFSSDVKQKTFALLNLGAIQQALEERGDEPRAEDISEETFGIRQLPLLQEQISRLLIPGLDLLLRQPRVYREHESKVRAACEWLDQQIVNRVAGSEAFKDTVLGQFRDSVETDTSSVRAFADDFLAQTKKDQDTKRPYFYNVFQQGLIRCWISVSTTLVRFELAPVESAASLVAALDALCFAPSTKYFNSDRLYVRRVLFNGERVLLNQRARDGWYDLIVASLLSRASLDALVAKLRERNAQLVEETFEAITTAIRKQAIQAAQSYLERLHDIVEDDLMKNYLERDLPESQIAQLSALDHSESEDDRKRFDLLIQAIAEDRKMRALEQLSNALKINKKELIARVD